MVAPITGTGGISGIGGVTPSQAPERTQPGFAEKIGGALESVSEAERQADALAQDVAAGGETSVHELMVATTKATLSVELLVELRNKAIEAYQEVMRMQV